MTVFTMLRSLWVVKVNKQIRISEGFEYNGAEFSPCRKYRYSLWRFWQKDCRYAAFVCLNPSTADETENDPTVRRCINYAHDWGYGGMIMLNIFAFRATEPKDMKLAEDPVGPDNDFHLRTASSKAGITVCGWGNHGSYLGRDKEALLLLKDPHCLTVTAGGHPGHPLYLKKSLKPRRYIYA